MKKRSPAGKNVERLSKNVVTDFRPPCQWLGTRWRSNRRLRTSMLMTSSVRRASLRRKVRACQSLVTSGHMSERKDAHTLPAVHALHLVELVKRWDVAAADLLADLGMREDILAEPD